MTLKLNKDFMEMEAEDYNLSSQPYEQAAFESIKNLDKNYSIVVDIGCGSGNVTKEILGNFLNFNLLIGLDIDPTMIKFAKTNNDNRNIQFKICNIEAKFETWDPEIQEFKNLIALCYSHLTLQWIDDRQTFAKNIKLLLKPGGEFQFDYLYVNNVTNFLPPHLKIPEGKNVWKKILSQEEEMKELKEVFKNGGLENVNVSYKEIYCEQETPKKDLFHLLVTFYKRKRINMEEFQKCSIDVQNEIEDFIRRCGLTNIDEKPIETFDYDQKWYYVGKIIISGNKKLN